MKLRQFGTPVALRMLYPKSMVVLLVLLHSHDVLRLGPWSIEMVVDYTTFGQGSKDIFDGVTRVAVFCLFVELLTAWLYTTRGLAW